jgi:hypothetical protein
MDWNAAIERNRDALKRILATLAAMAGLAVGPHPEVRAEGEPRRTLPRRLHLAVLRLLRPAESAARRLIVIAARGVVVELPPSRPRKPMPKSAVLRKPGGTGIWVPRGARPGPARAAPARLSLPLTDPLRRPFRVRRRHVPPHAAPRILFPGAAEPFSLPAPPSPYDPIDVTRLARRLAALASALDDLPREARRFARWKAQRDRARPAAPPDPPLRRGGGAEPMRGGVGGNRARIRRLSPLNPGRPPGQSRANSRRPVHEVHEVLADLHYFAVRALESPDTS